MPSSVTVTQLNESELSETQQQDIRAAFNRLYAFATHDPEIRKARLIPRAILKSPNCDKEWTVVHVHRGTSQVIEFRRPKANPFRYAIEGPAGIGKTTMLGRYAGGDLTELRKSPFALLAGTTDDFAYFRVATRLFSAYQKLSFDPPFIDRSDWMAPLVYNAYYNGYLFLFADDDVRDFIKHITPYEVIHIDDPDLTDEQLHARILKRGGMDYSCPLEYTAITRTMFALTANHYGLRTMTPTELAVLICQFKSTQLPSATVFPAATKLETVVDVPERPESV